MRTNILTIGGFDPCAGAGVLADIKTFEQLGLYGHAVNTANTIQVEDQFVSVNWVDDSIIEQQLDLLLSKYEFSVVKVGLIPSLGWIKKIKSKLNDDVKIVWDPILKASAGFEFDHSGDFSEALSHVYLITPNTIEAQSMMNENDAHDAAQLMSKHCHVLLKGGHSEERPGFDYLYFKDTKLEYTPRSAQVSAKHGSGCVLASAVASYLALGKAVVEACERAKTYTEMVLSSNESLLGYHNV